MFGDGGADAADEAEDETLDAFGGEVEAGDGRDGGGSETGGVVEPEDFFVAAAIGGGARGDEAADLGEEDGAVLRWGSGGEGVVKDGFEGLVLADHVERYVVGDCAEVSEKLGFGGAGEATEGEIVVTAEAEAGELDEVVEAGFDLGGAAQAEAAVKEGAGVLEEGFPGRGGVGCEGRVEQRE